MTELSIWLHDNYPIVFIVFSTIICTWGFNKYIATKPWVNNRIDDASSVSEKQIMGIRLAHEDLAKKIVELTAINTEVAKRSASFEASFQMFMEMQSKEK